MKIVTITPGELKNFRSGYGSTTIEDVKSEVLSCLPRKIKEEVKYRNIQFDYYTDPIEVPPFSIPYHFNAKDASEDLKNHLKKFVILVRWK